VSHDSLQEGAGEIMKYRKKPVVIEAEQFVPEPQPPHYGPPIITDKMFMEYPVNLGEQGPYLIIPTLEGAHIANPGDWIITGIKGERYSCKPDIFAATYEPA
jgi:hypothetical protein